MATGWDRTMYALQMTTMLEFETKDSLIDLIEICFICNSSAFTTQYKVAIRFILRLLYCHSVGLVSR